MENMASLTGLIRYYFKPHPRLVLAVVLSSVGFVLFETLSLAVVYPGISSVLDTGTADNSIVSAATSILGHLPGEQQAFWLLFTFGASYILMTVMNFLRLSVSDGLSRLITRDSQMQLFEKYLRSDYQYLLENQQGTILFRILTAPAHMTVMFAALPKLVVAVLKLVMAGIVLLLFSFELTLAMLALGVVFYAATRSMSDRVVYRNASRSQEASEAQTVVGNEAVTGIREIKIRVGEVRWIERFREHADRLCNLNVRNDLFRYLPSSTLQVGFMGVMLGVMFWQRETLFASMMDYLPLVGLYFYAFMRLVPALTEIAALRVLVGERRPYAEAVYKELHEPSSRVRDGSVVPDRFSDGVVFDGVSFTYPGRDHTLTDIDLVFEKGQTTALVGHSGCGKSTIADLIVRLFDVEEGRILIDGIDLHRLRLASWRRRIGYVSQDPFIINASVEDNIAFLSEGLGAGDVQEAARTADAHDFIMDLPEQYGTLLGDRGLKLSGGQRQRIAIARALAHKPDILIFDEATSALDRLSELEVQDAINRIALDHTVILIAHRLSTIRDADKIVVLENGCIREQGDHDTLMGLGGIYRNLYTSQEGAVTDTLNEVS